MRAKCVAVLAILRPIGDRAIVVVHGMNPIEDRAEALLRDMLGADALARMIEQSRLRPAAMIGAGCRYSFAPAVTPLRATGGGSLGALRPSRSTTCQESLVRGSKNPHIRWLRQRESRYSYVKPLQVLRMRRPKPEKRETFSSTCGRRWSGISPSRGPSPPLPPPSRWNARK